jgi:hypothetical protein
MEPGLLAARFCCFHLSCLLHHSTATLSNLSLEHRSKEVGAPTQLVQLKPRRRLVAALVGMFFTCS